MRSTDMELFTHFDLDLQGVLANLLRLITAFVVTLPIAWNREREERSLGLRTFPLVAVAACAFTLIGRRVAGGDENALSRVLQGLITGVGFLGAGAIVKLGTTVHGTATAAAIWATAAIGVAVALDYIDVALVLAVLCWGLLRGMRPFKKVVDKDGQPGAND